MLDCGWLSSTRVAQPFNCRWLSSISHPARPSRHNGTKKERFKRSSNHSTLRKRATLSFAWISARYQELAECITVMGFLAWSPSPILGGSNLSLTRHIAITVSPDSMGEYRELLSLEVPRKETHERTQPHSYSRTHVMLNQWNSHNFTKDL